VPLSLALPFSLPVATLLCDPFVLRDRDCLSYLILSYLIWPTRRQSQPLGSIRLSLATRTHLQRDRLKAVIQARNARMQLYSQLEIRHYCAKCVRVYTNPDRQG
jgi:hypothetical protein